jgi:adenosine/AMP kinase
MAGSITLEVVTVDKPADTNVIIGQAHFIKTVEDLHEALAGVAVTERGLRIAKVR